MEHKDKNYDPDVNCHSDDSEQELNNIRDACCSVGTPLENKDIFDWDGFTLNRFDEGRAGGALADNDPATKNKKTQRKGTCVNCKTGNVPLFRVNRHPGCAKEHAPYCEGCASGYDEEEDPIDCQHAMKPLPKGEADQIPLEPIYD